MKRVKKNCPAAMCHMGGRCEEKGDYEAALKYYTLAAETKAAELGDTNAHYNLSCFYLKGQWQCVEKDKKKAVYHWEEAAIGGHPEARYNLGIHEANNGRFERARKHLIIAANHGLEKSLRVLMKFHANGLASKEDYAGALRAYQAAVEATKSAEREAADAYFESHPISSRWSINC
jgi:tetratricopeptide (TPR) repeat protein